MRLLEKLVRVDAVVDHQTFERRAVVAVVVFLQLLRIGRVQRQKLRHIGRHVAVDLRKQVDVVRIERVVEVEDPVGDMGEVGLVRQAVELFHDRLMTWGKVAANEKNANRCSGRNAGA
ncbi:hypothetical protein D9M72_475700 [compost metagenome]